MCCEIVAIGEVTGLHEVRMSYEDVDDNPVRTQMAYGLGEAIVPSEEWKTTAVARGFTEQESL